jgi:ferritin-like protein
MNVERLRELLEAAVRLELATIPPYLCALYSVHPGTNVEATMVVRSVVVEEMLHMILAGNVLNAIGGTPRVSGPDYAPHYPHELPDGVILDLLPFSPAAVESFLQVENPKYKAEAAKAEHVEGRRDTVHASHVLKLADRPDTIGAFYAEIEAGLKEVAAEIGEKALFCGDPARQIGGDYYYAAGGAPVIVTDLESACRALQEVVEQGEGEMTSAFDADDDLAHYYRFEQLKYGRSYQPGDGVGIPTGPPVEVDFDAAYPMLPNPRLDEFADPDLRAIVEQANRQWSLLLIQIDEAFDGSPAALIPAVHTMFRLRDAMLVLHANPMPGHIGYHAGPTFEWIEASHPSTPSPSRVEVGS